MRAFLERHGVGRWAVNFLLILTLLGAGAWNYQQTTQAERALCAQKVNLEQMVASSEQYLNDVAQGKRKRVPGITDNDIRASIERQQTTIAAYSVLDCPSG